MTGEELAARIDTQVAELRASIGDMDSRKAAHVYECDDGKWVTAMLSPYECYVVERALFGEAIAAANYDVLRGKA